MERSEIRDSAALGLGLPRIALCSIRATKNRRSRTCECIPIPVPKTSLILLVSCPMRGASRGVRKWDRAKAGRRGNPKADAAPGDVPRKHALGRPWVSVRPVTGSATVSWLDGDRRAAQKRRAQGPLRGSAKSPEERTRVLRRRGGTLRGVAVCLCFPSAVIARLDRATQYSGPPESDTNGGDYWFPAFAGMTDLCAGVTAERAFPRTTHLMIRALTPQPRSTSGTRRSRPAGWWSSPTIVSPTTATGSMQRRSGWRRG
jgi:hypothetical protein